MGRMRSEDRLSGLDPARAQEFDPSGDVARGVKAGAIARGSEPAAPARRRRGLLIATGGTATAAIAAVAILAGGGGGGGAGLGPASALADAASSTSHFNSGVVTTHTVADNQGTLDATETLRFSGTDADVVIHAVGQVEGQEAGTRDIEVRAVGGKRYERTDGGDWTASDLPDGVSLGDAVAGDGLVNLVKTAQGVTQNGNTFHATVDGEALNAVSTTPLGDADTNQGPVGVTVELADDGSVHKLQIDTAGVSRSIEFSQMGAPQSITAP